MTEFIPHTNISIEQRKLLDEHLRLVLEINKTINLTRINTLSEGKVLHVEDSLVGLSLLQQAPDGLYGDLGSGAGFPGIPLAIMSGRKTVLIDSVQKKTQALDVMLKELHLQNQVTTYNGRAEDFSRTSPGTFAVITARAVSTMASLLELVAPLLKTGGWFICYKGQPEQDEINQALALEYKLGLTLINTCSAVLSDSVTRRELFVFKKNHEAQIALPRRNGMAQKRSLKP